MKRLWALSRNSEGVAAIEFALVFPVFMAVIAAIIVYGQILFVQQAVRNIIDEAVRRGVITQLTGTDIQTDVEEKISQVPGLQEFDVVMSDGVVVTLDVVGSFDLVFSALLPSDALTFEMSTQFPR